MGFSPRTSCTRGRAHGHHLLRWKVDAAGAIRNQPEVCDGLITDEPGVALVCFAADCTPVLLFDPSKMSLPRFMRAGAARQTALCARRSRRWHVSSARTPPISARQSVLAFRSAALKRTLMCRRLCLPPSVREADAYIEKRGEKYFVDNKGLNRLWLTRMGVTNIDVSQDCTMCQPRSGSGRTA